MRKVFIFFACLALLFQIWQWAASTYPNLLFVLPPPARIFKTIWQMRQRFWFHTSVTLKEMCCGFTLALCFAFPIAWIMIRNRLSSSVLQPIFIIIQCVPMFTLAPILVVWLGWSYTAIILPSALMILFPLTLNIYQGLRSTPDDLLEFFKSNQATAWQTFCKLQLPWAVPHIFAGFRIAAAIAGSSAIAGEWAGAQNGLGILMLESRRNADLEVTFGALFCLTCISSVLYCLILYCEKIALPPRRWKFPFKSYTHAIQKINLKKRFVLPFFLCSFCLFFGCQKTQHTHPTRCLLDWLPNPNHIPLYVGIEKGFFKEAGIDLCIQKMHEGGGGISYLVSKKADLLINHMPGTLKACEKGAKLKIVGLLIKEPLCGLTYHKDPFIQTPKDLCGKVFGYCIGLPDIGFLNFLLEKAAISPKEKKNVSVDLVSAMGTRSVDFIYGGFWNIEPAQLRAWNVETETFKIQELGVPPYYEMIILANAETFHASAAFALPFQKALQKSIDYCREDPEEAFASFMRQNPDRSAKSVAWQKDAWQLTLPLLASDQIIDFDLVKTFYTWQVEQGILEKQFFFQELIEII